jgi:hypothetical protein
MSPTPISYNANDITFTGSAGAVRVRKDTVTLALTGGPGAVGYKGYTIESSKPVEETVKLNALRKGLNSIRAAYSIVSPAVMAADMTAFTVNSPTPTVQTKGNQRIEGRSATIYTGNGVTRFLVTERGYVNLSAGSLGIRGMGPFDLTFTDTAISGRVDGDLRTLVVTYPPKMTRPMYHMDGQRWYAGFADDHSFTKGLPTPQLGIAFGVTAGPHAVEISEWTYPALPLAPARAVIE